MTENSISATPASFGCWAGWPKFNRTLLHMIPDTNLESVGTEIDKIPVKITYRSLELFSEGLYSSTNKAFEELICNSYDAGADKVSISVPDNLTKDDFVWVCDNGKGMNRDEFKDLWLVGFSKKRDDIKGDRHPIGKFGIGKLATFILANKLTHISKKDGEYIAVTMDYGSIAKEKDSVEISERQLTENEARAVAHAYGLLEKPNKVKMFGDKSSESWTVSLMTDLKQKVEEISVGRLKWILSTALPLNEKFRMYYNGQEIKSSKLDMKQLKHWTIGYEDKTAETMGAKCYLGSNEKWLMDLENIKGIHGEITLYRDSLVKTKSDRYGRSHGVFLKVHDRLINLDDPTLSWPPFSFGPFNRTRFIVHADELDNFITSTREKVIDTPAYEQLRKYVKKKIENEVVNHYYNNTDSNHQEASSMASRISPMFSSQPIHSVLKRMISGDLDAGETTLISHIDKNIDSEKIENALKSYELSDKPLEVISNIDKRVDMDVKSPIARFDPITRVLGINELHPFVSIFSGKEHRFINALAVSEVFTEAFLHGISDSKFVRTLMLSRDNILRQMASADDEGVLSCASEIKDAARSMDSKELETAMCKAFRILGFHVKPKGGSGKSEGVAIAKRGYNKSGDCMDFSVSFDAKTSQEGAISAKDVNFAAIVKHRDDDKANYAFVLGPKFQGELDDGEEQCNLTSMCVKNSVTVMTVSVFVRLLLLSIPRQLNLEEIEGLFRDCKTPVQCKEWVENLSHKEVIRPPYFDIVDAINEAMERGEENPGLQMISMILEKKTREKYTSKQIEEWVRSIDHLAPRSISIVENTPVGTQVILELAPDAVKVRLKEAIREIPDYAQESYNSLFPE